MSAADLEVGRRAREGLHVHTPLLRVQPERLQRSFLQPTCIMSDRCKKRKEKTKKRKDYAFRRQFDEKPSIIPGCPGDRCYELMVISIRQQEISLGLVKTE